MSPVWAYRYHRFLGHRVHIHPAIIAGRRAVVVRCGDCGTAAFYQDLTRPKRPRHIRVLRALVLAIAYGGLALFALVFCGLIATAITAVIERM